MDITKFNEKFNIVEGNIYTVEEVVTPIDGIYEAELIHDNANNINVYTGSRLTGEKINTYSTSTPSLTPWKTIIKIFSTEHTLYITYETTGDQVEAEDINNLQTSVNATQEELNKEIDRATNRENTIESNLNKEIDRAKAKETDIANNLSTEVNRAKAAEKVLTDNLASELTRATNAEAILTNNLNTEINRAKAKEISIDTELANRYTKDKVYTKDEVLAKIEELIGTAPEVLDTFGEIATALGNDPNFATTITTMLAGKVDKVTGKGLSTNDFTDTYKNNLIDCTNSKHDHTNKTIIDKITQTLLDNWTAAYAHITDAIKHITSAERTLWNTVSSKAEKDHNHDDRYYTETEIDNKLKNFTTGDELEEIEKQVLENNYTSIETDSVLTKLESAKDGFVDNMIIGGKTLQNVFSMGESIYPSTITKNGTEYFTSTDVIQPLIKVTLKPLTEYTVLAYMKSSNNLTNANNNRFFRVDTLGTGVTINGVSGAITQSYLPIKFKFTTTSDATIRVVLRNFYSDIDASLQSNTMYVKDIMILEGDWTDKETPAYFEGIKSVGEDDFVDGKYHINIISSKNLLCDFNDSKYIFNKEDGSITQTTTSDPRIWTDVPKFGALLKPNTTHTFIVNILVPCRFVIYDIATNGNSRVEIIAEDITEPMKYVFKYTTRADYNGLKLKCYDTTSISKVLDGFMILEGDYTDNLNILYSDTIDKIQLQLSEPLRSLPNGVRDTIDFEKGIVTRNVGKVILDGNASIQTSTGAQDNETTKYFQIAVNGAKAPDNNIGVACDKFASTSGNVGWDISTTFECTSAANVNRIAIRILKSKLATQDAVGLKAWLQANPVTVYYQLATPIIEKIDNKSTLQTFKDGYIQLENAITPVVDLDFSVSIPTVLSKHTQLIDSLIDKAKRPITWDELEGI